MRRSIIMLCLVISSVAIAACSEVTAPHRDGPGDPPCLSGYQTADGRWICPGDSL